MTYGVGYVGSKNTIAADIVNVLPKGERLIDLFGRGGAITHCKYIQKASKEVNYGNSNRNRNNTCK